LALAGALLLWPAGAALAAITFQGTAVTTQSNPAATSLQVNKPAAAVEGDLLTAQIVFLKGSDITVTAPAGWTLVVRTNSGSDIGSAIFRKFAGAAEPASYTWNFSQSVQAVGGMLAYSGVDPLNPIVASTGASGASGNLVAPSIASETDSWLIAFFGIKKRTSLSRPGGMTERYYHANNGDEVTAKAADEASPLANPTGTRASTPGSSDKWVAQSVTLRSAPLELDGDEDGVPDSTDNCPDVANTDQEDTDNDGIGDACEPDTDGDGVIDDIDNCVDEPNSNQADTDNDGIGDACEPDTDGDGVIDDIDNCVDEPNSNQADTDEDGIGDACDLDGDNDDVNDDVDNCPLDYNPDQTDTDNDGVGDACDTLDDGDGDGVPDGADQCLDTGSGEVVDGDGCSIAQLCPCENAWRNHGAYVSCVSTAAENLLDLGLIDETEKGAIVSEAGASQCGKKK
jgi:hypothetical protein